MTRTSRTNKRRPLALAGAAVVLVAGLSACGASAAEDDHPDHRTFDLPGTTLTIDSDDSALEIVAADHTPSGKIKVTRWFQGTVALGTDPEVTWSMDGDRLVLGERCSGVVADCSAQHRIEVPRGVAVTVEDKDGSVRARGFATRSASARRTVRSGSRTPAARSSCAPATVRCAPRSPRARCAPGPATARSISNSASYRTWSSPAPVTAP